MQGLESLRILIADDNEHMRDIVVAVLEGAGIKQFRKARDGSAALDILREWQADIAIVDFQMFPMDGVTFTRLVRGAPDTRDPYLPIIMMTGHSDRHRVEEARDAGVTEFVAKPLTAKAIIDRVGVVIWKPRPYVRYDGYFGPDRRRRHDRTHAGPDRRRKRETAEI